MACAYSHQGHGPRADQSGRIHISDFQYPATSHLQTAAGPYNGSRLRRRIVCDDEEAWSIVCEIEHDQIEREGLPKSKFRFAPIADIF